MTPLEAAWEEYGGTIQTTSRRWNKAKCPLHEDAHASARVDIDNQKWRCFAGCGSGDIYDLVRLHEQQYGRGLLNFRDVKALAMYRFGADGKGGGAAPKSRPGRRNWKPPWLR